MKYIFLAIGLFISFQAFANCEDIPQLKQELHDKAIFLQGYEKAQQEIKTYIINDYISKYEGDSFMENIPSFADQTTFKMNLERISLIKEIMRLKKECN